MPLDPLHARVVAIAAALPESRTVAPVLHQDDLAADKTLAMWGRGEPRDFVDVVALLNRYTEDDLLRLAGEKDRGFTTESFALSLRMVQRVIPRRWEVAGVGPEQAAAITASALDWADRL